MVMCFYIASKMELKTIEVKDSASYEVTDLLIIDFTPQPFVNV